MMAITECWIHEIEQFILWWFILKGRSFPSAWLCPGGNSTAPRSNDGVLALYSILRQHATKWAFRQQKVSLMIRKTCSEATKRCSPKCTDVGPQHRFWSQIMWIFWEWDLIIQNAVPDDTVVGTCWNFSSQQIKCVSPICCGSFQGRDPQGRGSLGCWHFASSAFLRWTTWTLDFTAVAFLRATTITVPITPNFILASVVVPFPLEPR